MCAEVCGDNRFEIIEAAKKDLIESTNIEGSPKEMEVLDSFLFRCWQMGWLKKYEKPVKHLDSIEYCFTDEQDAPKCPSCTKEMTIVIHTMNEDGFFSKRICPNCGWRE